MLQTKSTANVNKLKKKQAKNSNNSYKKIQLKVVKSSSKNNNELSNNLENIGSCTFYGDNESSSKQGSFIAQQQPSSNQEMETHEDYFKISQ